MLYSIETTPFLLFNPLFLATLPLVSGLAIQFLDQGLHRVIFDAMPMPVFVVDQDVSILEYNSAAAKLLGNDKQSVLKRRGGEVLHCVHSREHSQGCGHSAACPDCVIRNSVCAAVAGKPVTRQSASFELHSRGKKKTVDLQVSTQPLMYDKHSFVLLILEGLE